jgi:hypothetical protein
MVTGIMEDSRDWKMWLEKWTRQASVYSLRNHSELTHVGCSATKLLHILQADVSTRKRS